MSRIPRATYRLQLRGDFGFREVGRLVEYYEHLGISDLYLSPLFRSRKDSSHGYDVVDHAAMEREFGEPSDFSAMAEQVRTCGMGILLDVVPNHMGIHDPGNRWWSDVLENGEVSRYADYFDIDWHRLAANMRHKILLPVLGDHFGRVLERGELQLSYRAGRFQLGYQQSRFPLTPHSWPAILRPALLAYCAATGGDGCESPADPEQIELESIISQLLNLPPKTDRSRSASRERYREQGVASGRLERLVDSSSRVRTALEAAIGQINGLAGDPSSFDTLECLLDEQWYRLAYWRVAADEINYRRFFDVNDLAAIRVELPEVFQAVHALVERLLAKGEITGVRIDHPDGLLDPPLYFESLQKLYRRNRPNTAEEPSADRLYVVVEKILSGEEPLPADWPVCGTTGYELLGDLSRLLVDRAGVQRLRRDYASVTGMEQSPAEVVYESKKRILDDTMSSELHVLAGQLHRLTQRHRMSRDFTFLTLLRALRELVACFPVYRTYVTSRRWEVDEADYGRIRTAVRLAKRRNPTMEWNALDFLASVLLLEFPAGTEGSEREEFRQFVLKFQQVTGPVTAKGIEDTAFYRYCPLASLNEVGGELQAEPLSVEQFHRRMQHRGSDWPHSLSATATHDTKRGEDARARLHVLSEVAGDWLEVARRWQGLNRPLECCSGGESIPDRNEEYLLYQTLVATWPLAPMNDSQRIEYVNRIVAYMQKALREGKMHTSWNHPSDDYEEAALGFVRNVLDPARSSPFLEELQEFVEGIADAGFINGLAQVVLKSAVPGVPDFYQGTELWDFNLVDPDNRRPVDYTQRRQWLDQLQRRHGVDPLGLLQELLRVWPDPRIKLLVVWRTLQARAEFADVFQRGSYLPLPVSGARASHAVALARRCGDRWVVAAVPLHVQTLLRKTERLGAAGGLAAIDWQDTMIELPPEAPRRWKDAFSGQTIDTEPNLEGSWRMAAGRFLAPLPVGLLTSMP